MPNNGERLDPAKGIAACVIPGLGYAIDRQYKRAAYVFVGVMGLFLSGILVGGIDAVDRRDNHLWFIAQALTGPVAFATDHIHQTQFKVLDQGTLRHPNPDEWDAGRAGTGPYHNRPAIGKVADAASLLVALAGMMNLIAIIDCAFPVIPNNTRNNTRSNPATKPKHATIPARPGPKA